jgi:hypothetical protein
VKPASCITTSSKIHYATRDELLLAIHDKLNLHSTAMLFSVIFLHESEMAFEGEQKKSDEK